ncbi:hypothetical protein R80B4_00780 [Fibrobacteres bacterium R8-0-B4]
MKLINRTKKLVNEILLMAKQKKKARKARKNIPLQNEIAEKLDNYIADFLGGKIERFSAVPKKTELVGEKIFWQYWHQGIDDNTPSVINNCLSSVEKNKGDYRVILITAENIGDYIEMPDFIWKKLNKGGFNLPALSDLVRLYLLSAYGGVWLDATIYLTKPIDERWLRKDFFALQRSETPPHDASVYEKFDPLYFSWNPVAQVKLLNSFIIAKPNNKIVGDLLSILLEYWKKESQTRCYHFFQICFNRMMQHKEWYELNCELVGDTDCHTLQILMKDDFDHNLYTKIISRSNIHKLTTYFEKDLKKKRFLDGSFYDVIMNGKIERGEVCH